MNSKRECDVKDSIYAQLDESKLTKAQKRDLLCEIICELKPSKKDAILAARILGNIPHNGASMREMLDFVSDHV